MKPCSSDSHKCDWYSRSDVLPCTDVNKRFHQIDTRQHREFEWFGCSLQCGITTSMLSVEIPVRLKTAAPLRPCFSPHVWRFTNEIKVPVTVVSSKAIHRCTEFGTARISRPSASQTIWASCKPTCSSVRDRTTAPAPSPKRTAASGLVQSMKNDNVLRPQR